MYLGIHKSFERRLNFFQLFQFDRKDKYVIHFIMNSMRFEFVSIFNIKNLYLIKKTYTKYFFLKINNSSDIDSDIIHLQNLTLKSTPLFTI